MGFVLGGEQPGAALRAALGYLTSRCRTGGERRPSQKGPGRCSTGDFIWFPLGRPRGCFWEEMSSTPTMQAACVYREGEVEGRQVRSGVCVQELDDTALAGEQRWAAQSVLLKPHELFPSPQHLRCGGSLVSTSARSGNARWEGSWQSKCTQRFSLFPSQPEISCYKTLPWQWRKTVALPLSIRALPSKHPQYRGGDDICCRSESAVFS